jgi:Amiloride-sensitive sodium channel
MIFPDVKELLEKPPWNIMSIHEYLFMESWPFVEYQSVSAQIGFICFIHRTNELPSESSARFFQHLNFTEVFIHSQQTLISDEVRQMSIQRRNCYLEHEKTLELFQVYSKQNCEHECQSFAFARQCGCVPFYLLSELQIKTDLFGNSFMFLNREIRREDLRCPKPKLHRVNEEKFGLGSCQVQLSGEM